MKHLHATHLGVKLVVDLSFEKLLSVSYRLLEPLGNIFDLLKDALGVALESRDVFVHSLELLCEAMRGSFHLIIDSADLPLEDLRVSGLAALTDLLFAMCTHREVVLLVAHGASLHKLTSVGIRRLSGDLDVRVEEALQRHVGREVLDAVVGDAVLCAALRAFHLSLDIVHEALHAGLHAHGVLTWQQLGVAVAVEADAAGQQLLQLTGHSGAYSECPPYGEHDTV